MTLIVMLPIIIYRPYGIDNQSTVYTEDGVSYNDAYLKLFDEPGTAIEGDFLLINHYDVKTGSLIILSVYVVPGSASIDAIAVFLLDEEEITVLKSTLLPIDDNTLTIPIDGAGIYCVAVFGHKMSSNAEIDVLFTVVVNI